MTQLSEEQRERVKQIESWIDRRTSAHSDPYVELSRALDGLRFVLSLLDSDSQAAGASYSKLAHEIISEYNNADDPGLLRSKVTEGFAHVASNAATAMRDKCVEKLKAKAASYQKDADNPRLFPNYRKQMAFAATALSETVSDLESLTLDQVKPEKQ